MSLVLQITSMTVGIACGAEPQKDIVADGGTGAAAWPHPARNNSGTSMVTAALLIVLASTLVPWRHR
jgi:hypothetical protein